MDRYAKYAVVIQFFSCAIIFFNGVLTIMHWFFSAAYTGLHAATGLGIIREFNIKELSVGQQLSGFMVEGIASVLLMYGFLLMIQLMNCIKANHYFTLETIGLLKKITKIALIYTVYCVLCGTVLSVITSLHHSPSTIAIGFGMTDIINIMVFCCMFLVLSIFQKGYELKHEQELTI